MKKFKTVYSFGCNAEQHECNNDGQNKTKLLRFPITTLSQSQEISLAVAFPALRLTAGKLTESQWQPGIFVIAQKGNTCISKYTKGKKTAVFSIFLTR